MDDKLKLTALDADDLGVISAACQDALVAVRDCAYFKDERRFVLLLNRFRWEADPTVEAAHSRTHSALVFNELAAVRLFNEISDMDYTESGCGIEGFPQIVVLSNIIREDGTTRPRQEARKCWRATSRY